MDIFKVKSVKIEKEQIPCVSCQKAFAQEKQDLMQKHECLMGEIQSLKSEIANILNQKELLMKSQISGTGMSSNNLVDQ